LISDISLFPFFDFDFYHFVFFLKGYEIHNPIDAFVIDLGLGKILLDIILKKDLRMFEFDMKIQSRKRPIGLLAKALIIARGNLLLIKHRHSLWMRWSQMKLIILR
jgi:hypothetical protein